MSELGDPNGHAVSEDMSQDRIGDSTGNWRERAEESGGDHPMQMDIVDDNPPSSPKSNNHVAVAAPVPGVGKDDDHHDALPGDFSFDIPGEVGVDTQEEDDLLNFFMSPDGLDTGGLANASPPRTGLLMHASSQRRGSPTGGSFDAQANPHGLWASSPNANLFSMSPQQFVLPSTSLSPLRDDIDMETSRIQAGFTLGLKGDGGSSHPSDDNRNKAHAPVASDANLITDINTLERVAIGETTGLAGDGSSGNGTFNFPDALPPPPASASQPGTTLDITALGHTSTPSDANTNNNDDNVSTNSDSGRVPWGSGGWAGSSATPDSQGAISGVPWLGVGYGQMSSSAGPGGDAGGGAGNQDERRQRRLARNRESARQSRRRKKEHLELLEDKVNHLNATIEGLRRMQVENAARQIREVKAQCLCELESKIQEAEQAVQLSACQTRVGVASDSAARGSLPSAVEDMLSEGLRQMAGRVRLDCRERQAVVRYQMESLEGLAAPAYARFLLWLMMQDESFFRPQRTPIRPGNIGSLFPASTASVPSFPSPEAAAQITTAKPVAVPANPGAGGGGAATAGGSPMAASAAERGLWSLICRELGLTDEQDAQLRNYQGKAASYPGTRTEREKLRLLAQVLGDLGVSTQECMKAVHRRIERLMDILTPSQMVRYLGWVSRGGDALSRSVIEGTSLKTQRQQRRQGTHTSPVGRSVSPTALSNVVPSRPAERKGGSEESDRVLGLLNMQDGELSLSDMAWLMKWVRDTQEKKGQMRSCTPVAA